MTITNENEPVATAAPSAWLAELEAHIWAIRPEVLNGLAVLAADGSLPAVQQNVSDELAAVRRGRPPAIRGGIAKVNLKGALMPGGGSLLGLLFGFPNPLDTFMAGFREAMGSSDVGAVIIDVDSPGGVTDNIPEAAAEIRDLRKATGKPVVAAVNTLAASAAYWLASQADEITITPSGGAGSIGVYAMHRDYSRAYDGEGITNTLISAGKYKVSGNPFEPLSDEARAHIQSDVDYFYNLFTADVARGRDATQQAVKDGYGEGRVLPAKAALDAKLVDRIETLGETVTRLASRSKQSSTTSAEALDAGADDTVNPAEADAGANEEQGRLLARLEGSALLQDRAWDKVQPGS